jgi:hypothetical protein
MIHFDGNIELLKSIGDCVVVQFNDRDHSEAVIVGIIEDAIRELVEKGYIPDETTIDYDDSSIWWGDCEDDYILYKAYKEGDSVYV